MNMFRKIKELITSAATFRSTVKQWLGEGGKPVPQKLAQARADFCLRCKFNQHKDVPIEVLAGVYIQHLESKKKMRLGVFGEHALHTCQLCSCFIPLKVHVPHTFIRQHQPEAIRQKIRLGKPDCWQLDSLR